MSPVVLSIVIPVYNTANYLESCLSSVLAGDWADCEILLVDDGLHRWHQPRAVRPVVGSASRPGAGDSSGEPWPGRSPKQRPGGSQRGISFFLDSDDTIPPHALTTLKEAIRKTGAEIIAFQFLTDDGEGHRTPYCANAVQLDTPFTTRQKPEFLLSIPSACCRIWRRSLFLSSGIRFPSRVWYEDLRTTVKLFVLAKSIVTLPDPLYHYLQRPGSIMRSGNVARNREILDAFDDLLSWFQRQGLLKQYHAILCRLCIDHVYLAASVRVLTEAPRHPLLGEFQRYLEHHFPDYRSNLYLAHLSRSRKLVFRLLEGRHYRLLRFLFRTKGRLA